MARPGRKRAAGTRRSGLFDIVRWNLRQTVRRRAASSVAVIVPSPLVGEGSSVLPCATMGEGAVCREPPHPFEFADRPLCPLPQGERARKGTARRMDQTQRCIHDRASGRSCKARVVAFPCFRPVPACYRRPNRAAHATPVARISRLHPAAYGKRETLGL